VARFVAERAPEHIEWCGQLRPIPFKRTLEPAITCLDREEMQALLDGLLRSTEQGQRDYALLPMPSAAGYRYGPKNPQPHSPKRTTADR
jgi:hypothetical protein